MMWFVVWNASLSFGIACFIAMVLNYLYLAPFDNYSEVPATLVRFQHSNIVSPMLVFEYLLPDQETVVECAAYGSIDSYFSLLNTGFDIFVNNEHPYFCKLDVLTDKQNYYMYSVF